MKRFTPTLFAALTVGAFASANACAAETDGQQMHAMADATSAVAVMDPTEGHAVRGVVRLTRTAADSVRVQAEITGLPPNSRHGFHVHEFGDCTAADAKSAGGHFDPAHTGHHAAPGETPRHAGDLGNLETDARGTAHLIREFKGLTIAGMGNAVMGRALIVHEKQDTFVQPTGGAGPRLACGVIGMAK